MTEAEPAFKELCETGAGGSFVVAQLGQSLDGRIALPSGESKYINGPAALDHLHRLRSMVDAIIVGIGTVIADDPRLTVRRVKGQNPARVVIDPNARLFEGCCCLENNGAPIFVLRREGCESSIPSGAEPIHLEVTEDGFSCEAIVGALAARGLRRLLVEGGGNTVSRFFDEGQLDRLHLLIGPVLLGEGKPGLNFQARGSLASAVRVKPRIYDLGGGDVLIDCPLRRKPGTLT